MNEELEPDTDLEAALGFEPAIAATGAPARPAAAPATGATRRPASSRARRTRLRTKLGAGAVLVGALGLMGGAYATFAASSSAADSTSLSAQVTEGRQLFAVGCITCHGANLQGVQGRGPSLIGVGAAATYFQVSTGRMPLAQQGVEAARKDPRYNEAETRALSAYVQSIGGGPAVPTGSVEVSSAADIANGGELFRLNCAQCHGATGRGAPLSAGKYAPALYPATPLQVYTAMVSGPESMPVFNDNQLTPQEKKEIVSYVEVLKSSADPGGSGVGRIGPVSEAIVIWVGGVGALMVAILWIGAKVQ